MFAKPEFRRVYWRLACDMAQGPMDPAVSGARLNDWYQVFVSNGIAAVSPSDMSAWIAARRNEYLQALAPKTNVAFRVTTPDTVTNRTPITLTGEAPIAVTSIEVNSRPHAIKWVSDTTWQIRAALDPVLMCSPSARSTSAARRSGATRGASPTLAGGLPRGQAGHQRDHVSSRGARFELHRNPQSLSTETLPLGGLRVDGAGQRLDTGASSSRAVSPWWPGACRAINRLTATPKWSWRSLAANWVTAARP
jgi:hypothetical protein